MPACSGGGFLFISGKLTIHGAFRRMLMVKTGQIKSSVFLDVFFSLNYYWIRITDDVPRQPQAKNMVWQ